METIDVQLDAEMMKDLKERADSMDLLASEYASLVITDMIQNTKRPEYSPVTEAL